MSFLQLIGDHLHAVRNDVGRHDDLALGQLGQAFGDRHQGHAFVALAFRTPQVAGQNQPTAVA